MPVRRDKRTGRWFFRFTATTSAGRRSHYGTPGKVGSPYEHLPNTKRGAKEAESIARERLRNPPPELEQPEREVPTLHAFCEDYYLPKMQTIGNRKGKNKPATLSAKESHLRVHLYPRFGDVSLDQIDDEDI